MTFKELSLAIRTEINVGCSGRAVVDFRRQQRRGQPRKKRGYAITYQSMNNTYSGQGTD